MPRVGFLQRLHSIFNRPFFILVGGTGAAQLIALLSAPALTRLYNPEAYAFLSVFSATLAVLGTIAGGRYEQSIIGEGIDKSADELVILVASLALLFSASLPFILHSLLPLTNAPAYLADLTGYLAAATFAYVVGQAFTSWLVRKGGFAITSSSKVIQALAVLIMSLCLTSSVKGLVIASMSGYVFGGVALAIGARRLGWLPARVKLTDLQQLALRHIKFPLMGAFPALCDSISMLLPVYLVAMYFSAAETGQFGLSRQILAAPIGLLSLAVTQLLMKRLVDAKASGASMLPTLRNISLLVSGPTLGFSLLFSFVAPDLFARLFGEVWRPAGMISRWMVWAYVGPMLVSPLSSVLIVLRKIGSNGVWQMLHCAGIFMLVTFFRFADIEQFVKVLVIFELISYGAYAALIAHATYDYEKKRD